MKELDQAALNRKPNDGILFLHYCDIPLMGLSPHGQNEGKQNKLAPLLMDTSSKKKETPGCIFTANPKVPFLSKPNYSKLP